MLHPPGRLVGESNSVLLVLVGGGLRAVGSGTLQSLGAGGGWRWSLGALSDPAPLGAVCVCGQRSELEGAHALCVSREVHTVGGQYRERGRGRGGLCFKQVP